MKYKIMRGATIPDSGKWPDIEYGDINIVFDVKLFGNPDYALCYAPNFGLDPFGNGPLYVERKYLKAEGAFPDILSFLKNM